MDLKNRPSKRKGAKAVVFREWEAELRDALLQDDVLTGVLREMHIGERKFQQRSDPLTSSERSVELASTSRQRQHSNPLTSSKRSFELPSTSRQRQHYSEYLFVHIHLFQINLHLQRDRLNFQAARLGKSNIPRGIQGTKCAHSPERTRPITPPRTRGQSGSKYQDRPLRSPVLSSFLGTTVESDQSLVYSDFPVFSPLSFDPIGMQFIQDASSMSMFDHPPTLEQPPALTLALGQPPQPLLVQPPSQPLAVVQPELPAQINLPVQPLPLVQPKMAGQVMLPAQPLADGLPHGPQRSKKQSKIIKELRRLTKAVNNLNRSFTTQLDLTMSRFSLEMRQSMEKISLSMIEAMGKNCKAPLSGDTSETLSLDP